MYGSTSRSPVVSLIATRELNRANALRLKNVIPPQDLDQRVAEKQAAEAAVDNAKAAIADAKFDLDHCRITAPFTGQIGTHLVSVSNLITERSQYSERRIASNWGSAAKSLGCALSPLAKLYPPALD